MNKKIFAFFILIFGACNTSLYASVRGVEPDAPVLSGAARQGGMLHGQTGQYRYVYKIGDEKIRVSHDKIFVVGLGRDEPAELKLLFCKFGLPGRCDTFTYAIEQRTYPTQNLTVADAMVRYAPEIQKRVDSDAAAVSAARRKAADDNATHFMDLSLSDILARHRISTVFGAARNYNNGARFSSHNGIDIAAPTGTQVHSIGRGTVIYADDNYLSGNMVIVSHGRGVTSVYAHMDKIMVAVGDTVDNKTVVGMVGNTGRSTGPHLHLGASIMHGGRVIQLDPLLLMN
ncbi:MAG: M23 family metallopeptidase [Alphaproteobacteria bacterium]|nr:M23 family metallopeptidase [Alphaproteobacteria bacterium]